MSSQFERLTARGHHHAEAFCLMPYACRDCGHRETIWNSRDGVTPFGTRCPSCGGLNMLHVFHTDAYAPDHKPHPGQRVWVSMTQDRAMQLARRNILLHKKPGPETDLVIESVAAGYFHDGHGVDMRIEGYAQII